MAVFICCSATFTSASSLTSERQKFEVFDLNFTTFWILYKQAEQLGNDGNVDEAKEKTTLCDQLRAERLQLQEVRIIIYKCVLNCLVSEM